MTALVVIATQFLVALDGSLLNIALPSIARDLELSLDELAWIQNAYALGLGSFLVLAGGASDVWSPHRVFVGGAVGFATAAVGAAVAPSAEWLAVARGVAGFSAALVFPSGLALLATLAAGAEARARAIGAWGAATAVAAPVGAVAGGVSIEALGWRSTLLVGVAAALAPAVARSASRGPRVTVGVASWVGAALVTCATCLLIIDVAAWGGGGGSAIGVVPSVVVAILAVVSARILRATEAQPMRLGVLRDRQVGGATLIAFLGGGSLLAMAFFLNQYLQAVRGLAPGAAGLAYAPLAIAFAAASPLAARLTIRHGSRRVIASGFATGGGALLWLSDADATSRYWDSVLFPLVLAGLSLGLVFVGMVVAAVRSADARERGLVGGLVNAGWQLGGVVGLAASVAIVSPPPAVAVSQAFELEAAVAIGAALVTLLLLPARDAAADPDMRTAMPYGDGNGELRRGERVNDSPT